MKTDSMSVGVQRMERILPSQTIAITQKARALKAQGRDIISLSAGEPDFDTPDFIKQAAIESIKRGETKYTDVAGTPELRQAVAEWLNKDFELEYQPEEITVSTGGKQVIYNVMTATLNVGDEVIIPAPAWVSYPDIVRLADGSPVVVPTDEETGFRLTAAQLRQVITPRTRWLVLNSPCNPTGTVYSKEELKALAEVLLEYPDVWVLTDDIYAKLVYDGRVSSTMAQVEPRLRDRTVTMNGVSKAYAMTGWRIGFAAAPLGLTKQLTKLQGQSTNNACSIAQAAAYAALSGPQDCIAEMIAEYQKRRDFVVEKLSSVIGLECLRPEGAFYVFVSIKQLLGKSSPKGTFIETDEDFVTALLEETGVAAVHGSAFMMPGYFRVSYATSIELLEEACARIRSFCEEMCCEFRPASRVSFLPTPATIAVAARARELTAQGKPILSLALGQPDFSSPQEALMGAIAEVEEGNTGYPPVVGQKKLLEAIAHKFKRDNGLDVPLSKLMVSNGGKQVIFNAFMASLEEGDEVIVPSPYWVSYPLIAKMFGAKVIEAPCFEENGFRPDPEVIRQAITPATRWLVLNFPNNPTGAILERKDLEVIADILRDAPHVLIMCDEIYEHLTFGGRQHVSLAQVAPDLAHRILIVNGVSKAYAMTGWRVGFACGPEPLIRAMIKVQGNVTSGICTLAQGGAVAALNSTLENVQKMCQTYEQRRDKVVEFLRQIPGLTCAVPEGAFYAYPGISAFIGKHSAGGRLLENDVAFTEALLEEEYLATVPGSAFGRERHLRLSFAASDDQLMEACTRLERFAQGIS